MLLLSELDAVGVDERTINQQLREGALVRVRRGAFQRPAELTAEDHHRELVRVVLAQSTTPAVISHESAAVLHDLPIDRRRLERVHLLREGRSRSDARGLVVRHSRPGVAATEVDGVPVTTLASTVIDLARSLPFRDGVAAADQGLRRGLERADLVELLDEAPRMKGNPRARRVLAFADGRSESAGESHTRARIAEAGLPVPDLQFIVRDRVGEMRTDFVWPKHRVIGEFDGMIKYGRLLRPGQSLEDVLVAERERELRLLRAGWEVIRFVWRDLRTVEAVAAIVKRGFADAARRFAQP